MNNNQKMIIVRNLSKRLGNNIIFDGLDLEVEAGETRVILGRSGSGKSVLLKHIVGIIEPDSGEIIVDGIKLDHNNQRSLEQIRKRIGMLFQGSALFDSLDVRGNVGFALDEQSSLAPQKIDAISAEMLRLVDLSGTEIMMPAELSGGMKKRVGLARALASRPKIVLYDEPTTGLDPITADMINKLIVDLKHKLEVTSIVVTHDIISAYKVADRISMLYKGKIIMTGDIEEIQGSDDPIIVQFVKGEANGPITEGV